MFTGIVFSQDSFTSANADQPAALTKDRISQFRNDVQEPSTVIPFRPVLPEFRPLDKSNMRDVPVVGTEKDILSENALKSNDIKVLAQQLGKATVFGDFTVIKHFSDNNVLATVVSLESDQGTFIYSEYQGDFGKRTNAALLPLNNIPSRLTTVNGQLYKGITRLNCPDCVIYSGVASGGWPGTGPGVDLSCMAEAVAACKVTCSTKPELKKCIAAAAITCATIVDTCIPCS